MKILKTIFILILFTTLITSCTPEDIGDELEINSFENIQATGEEGAEADQTEKG